MTLRTCQHRSQCESWAVWGLYRQTPGKSGAHLERVFCGRHKPRLRVGENARLVRIAT